MYQPAIICQLIDHIFFLHWLICLISQKKSVVFLKLTQKSAVTTHHYHFPTTEEPLFKTGRHIKPLGSGSQKTSSPWGVMQVVLNTPWGGIMYERLQVGVNKTLRNHSISSWDLCHEVLTKLLWVWGSFITDILSVYQLWVPHWDPLSPWSCPLKHRQLSQLSTPLGISMKGHATRRSHDKVDIDTSRCRSGQQVHLHRL